MAQEKMTERLVTVVLTLVVASVLGVLGTALAGGALIGTLGGVQETEPTFDQRVGILNDEIQALQARIEGPNGVPAGAIAAFDLSSGCPDGWIEFADAAGRTIIGQGSGMVDENRTPLTGRKYREHGGEEKHALSGAEIPAHIHSMTGHVHQIPSHDHNMNGAINGQPFGYHAPSGQPDRYRMPIQTEGGFPENWDSNVTRTGAGGDERTNPTGENQSHNNMPPYVALYICKKA